jgi:hypothetical protein
MYGIMMFMMFGFYAYTYWIGSTMIHERRINVNTGKAYDAGSMLTILMGMMMGMMTLMSLTPNI